MSGTSDSQTQTVVLPEATDAPNSARVAEALAEIARGASKTTSWIILGSYRAQLSNALEGRECAKNDDDHLIRKVYDLVKRRTPRKAR